MYCISFPATEKSLLLATCFFFAVFASYADSFASTLTITPKPVGGTVTSSRGGINCGDGGSVCTSTNLTAGTSVTLTATPSSINYTFDSWNVAGSTSTTNPLTIPMPTADMSGTATFIYWPPVNGVCGGDAGGVFVNAPTNLCSPGSSPGATGSNTTWDWTCYGSYGGASPTCSATRQYLVTYTATTGGTLNGTASQQLNYNSNATTVTAVPNTNYIFTNWTEGANVVSTSPGLTITNVTANHSYVAHFVEANLIISPKPVGGTVVSDMGGINCGDLGNACLAQISTGDSVTLRAMPGSISYTFTSWTVGTNTFTANPLTFSMPAATVTGTATFTYHAPVNGACNPATTAGTYFDTPAELCSSGYSPGAAGGTSTWDWTCYGSYGGSNIGCSAARATAAVPVVTLAGANMATVSLQIGSDGTGYLTLLAGGTAVCGSSSQTKAGLDSLGNPATRSGSLSLKANTSGTYTLRNLPENSTYTICFTAENSFSMLPAPNSATVTTTSNVSLISPQWHVFGDPPSGTGGASLAFGPDGTPHLGFRVYATGIDTVGRYSSGGNWSTLADVGFSSGSNMSLVFAPDGTPYLAFDDFTNHGETVMKYSSGVWTVAGNPAFAAGGPLSLAFAPDNTPYVAFRDANNGNGVTVMKLSGGMWTPVGSPGFSRPGGDTTGAANYVSLAIAPDGTPYVGYQDQTVSSWLYPEYNQFKATVMRFSGNTWSTVGSRGFSAGDVTYTSLSFAPNGTPYLAFVGGFRATVMCYSGGAWSVVGNAGFSTGQAEYLSLALAADGTPSVAYRDVANGSKITVQNYHGGAWSVAGSAGFSTGEVTSVSLAFAPDGTPYVAYNDTTLQKIMVMRFFDLTTTALSRLTPVTTQTNAATVTYRATFGAPVSGVSTTNFDLSPTVPGAAVTGVIPVGTPPSAQWDITVATGSGVGSLTLRLVNDYGMSLGVTNELPFAGEGYAIDTVPPRVSIGAPAASIFFSNAVDYAITYGDPNFNASTLTAGNVILNSTGTASGTVSVSGSGASRIVTISNISGSGTLGISLAAGTATDTLGNSASAAGPSATFAVPLAPIPALATPGVINVGAGMATLVLPEDVAMNRYFTLLAGSNTPCGTGGQVRDGQDSIGNPAFRFGSLPLAADPIGHYTLRNLSENTAYTVCYTANSSVSVLQVPTTTNMATTASAAMSAPLWYSVGNPGFSAGQTTYPSLAFAPDGIPYVAYQDSANGNKATVMKFSGGVWTVEGSAGFSAGVAATPSFVFAPDGTPYIAYQDGTNGNKVTVMKFSGGVWSVEGSPAFSAGSAPYPSLAFAPNGIPYVAYQDDANGSRATVMRFSGGAWSPVGNVGFSAGQGSPYWPVDLFLAFAPDGTPHVGYPDVADINRATVMKYSDGGWLAVGDAGISPLSADNVSLAFAPDGTLHASYRDISYGNKATVKKYGSGSWSVVGSTGFTSGINSLSFAFAPDGIPYVAYMDSANGNKATVMKYSGGTWSVVGGAGFSAGQVYSLSLDFAPDGTPHVAYRDDANGSKATVMRFADKPPTVATTAASSITATGATLNGTVNSYGATAAVSFEYGTTTAYGSTVSAGSIAVAADTPVSAAITGLSCGTTYHYRVKASNSSTRYGNDLFFSTPSCLIQSITFAPLAAANVGQADFDPGATASSGLPVSYSSSDTSVATIVNGKVHLVAGGSTTITASQGGNGVYSAAQSVSQALNVHPAVTITLTFSGSGGGSVNGDLACTSAVTCNPVTLIYGTPVSLTATADSWSFFNAWSGACSGGNPCQPTMDRDRTVTAAFSAADRARIGSTGYASLALAYGAVSTLAPTTVKTLDMDLGESLVFDATRNIVLWGGWGKDFTATTGLRTLLHLIRIKNGRLTIKGGVAIR